MIRPSCFTRSRRWMHRSGGATKGQAWVCTSAGSWQNCSAGRLRCAASTERVARLRCYCRRRNPVSARVLIIEDNAANLELMTYLLSAFGHTVLTADNGHHGLEAAVREQPELIICDLQLPDIDGFELARHLHRDSRLCSIPLVAVTALAMVGDRDRVLAAGFDGYLAKPIDPETFVPQMESFLPDWHHKSAPHPQAS